MSLLTKAGVTKLSQLGIDADKDWGAKNITHVGNISIGDVIFANGYRLTEVENGIALLSPNGKVVKLFKETKNVTEVDKWLKL